MTTANSTLLGLALPVEGELDGTWGDVVNNATTQYLDIAIAGTQTLSTDADATLVQTYGTNLATNIGSTTAQYAIIRWTASNGATTRYINVPNLSKTYVVLNDGTGSIVLRGTTGPTTGITITAGEKCVAAWNGSDFVKISSSSTFVGTITVSGTSATAGGIVLGEDTDNGTNTTTLKSAASLASDLTFTLPSADGSNGQALVTNGSGTLSFGTAGITTGKSIAMAMIFGF